MKQEGKKPIFKKWWFWLIVIAVIGAIGSAAGSGDREPSAQTPPPAQSELPSAPPTQAVPETPSEEAEPSHVFHVGDTVETGHVSITYQECDANWTGYDRYFEPKDGMKVVRAYFVFENTGNSDYSCGSFILTAMRMALPATRITGPRMIVCPTRPFRRGGNFRGILPMRYPLMPRRWSWSTKPPSGPRIRSYSSLSDKRNPAGAAYAAPAGFFTQGGL